MGNERVFWFSALLTAFLVNLGAQSAEGPSHLFEQNIAPNTGAGYSNTIWLIAGERIDFMVSRGYDQDNTGSGLKIEARLDFIAPSASNALYQPPPGGWTYLYGGDQVLTGPRGTGFLYLDGTWYGDNLTTEWDTSLRGAGNGLRGGISTDGDILTIEDAVTLTSGTMNNRKIFFVRTLEDLGNNASRILDEGVTITFRARLTPNTVLPAPEIPLPDGYGIFSDGKGNFSVRQAGENGAPAGLISFALVRAAEDESPTERLNFGQSGLVMNRNSGDNVSDDVDSSDTNGIPNLLPLDPTAFHEFWIVVEGNDATPGNGTHTVTIYIDGSTVPSTFDVSAGRATDVGSVPPNYLGLGCSSSAAMGAFDTDFIGYKAGVFHPAGAMANRAPALSNFAPAHESILFAGSNINVSVIASDPDGSVAQVEFFIGESMDGRTLLGTTTSAPYTIIWSNAFPGNYYLTARATDDLGRTTTMRPVSVTILPRDATIVEQYNFDSNSRGWSPYFTQYAPIGLRQFLGRFSEEETTTLQLSNLPPHATITIAFDLFIIGSWDGNYVGTVNGPDIWEFKIVNGPTLLRTSFANSPHQYQSYPAWHPGPNNLPRFGAAENNTLGYYSFTGNDAFYADTVYRFQYTIGHTASSITYSFASIGLLNVGDESWGLDNVVVAVSGTSADLALSQSPSPNPITVSNVLSTTVTVSNRGPHAASGILLTDMPATGMQFLSFSNATQGTYRLNDGRILWEVGGLPASTTASLTWIGRPTIFGQNANALTVKALEPDPNGSNNVHTSFASVRPFPMLSINDVALREGDAGQINATFTVRVSFSSSLPISVDFTTSNGTAIADNDYLPVSGTLNFPIYTNTRPITVQILGDLLYETNENLMVALSNPVNAGISDPIGILTITNDDVLRVTYQEENSNPADLRFFCLSELPYALDCSTNLTDWAEVFINQTGGTNQRLLQTAQTNSHRFYRGRRWP